MSYQKIDTSSYPSVMQKYSVSSLLAKVLVAMKYSDDDIASFFCPLNEYTFVREAYQPIAETLQEIKAKNRKVFIFGDYDCDGICATTIMVSLLNKMGIECGYYIPSRLNEGYGLNVERLSQAYDKGYEVLVTVDNGVSAHEGLKWAREHDMVTIVTDHHIIESEVECDHLLHPDLMGQGYQYLCGAGVVYMLARYMGLHDSHMAILAMLATIGDVMSLKGINIKIINDGLKLLNEHQYRNLEMLENFSYPLDENDIGFRIVPKINAVGRMSESAVSQSNQLVRYLLSNDPLEIQNYVRMVNSINDKRRELSASQYQLVKNSIRRDDVINLIYHPDLHLGLLGLIANRISTETNKITIIMTDNHDDITGSVRSVGQVDVMNILNGFRENTIHLGGHAKAAGITIARDKLEMFDSYMHQQCADMSVDEIFEYVDVELDELTEENIAQLFSYRPYGQDRRIPLMHARISNQTLQTMRNDHQLKWRIGSLDVVSFDNEGYDAYAAKDYLDIIFNLSENKFRGKLNYQLMVKIILD